MNRITSSRIDALALSFSLLLPTGNPAAKADGVEEPPDYKQEDYRSPTPATLNGAQVVTTQQAREIWHKGEAVFIDVMPRAPKPADLPPDLVWRDQTRQTIPGAVWLPNVGYARLAPEVEGYFRRSLEELTGGDKAKPILFFCMADCWMSWNAAKRAREEYGYTNVIWFPQGTDGWGFPDAPLVKVEPRP